MIRTINVILILAMVSLSVLLYAINYQADSAERAGNALRRQIVQEQEAIRVLRAEWSYLNQPDRLQELSSKYLDLQPATAQQVGSFDSIPFRPAPDVPTDPATDPASVSAPEIRGSADNGVDMTSAVQVAKVAR